MAPDFLETMAPMLFSRSGSNSPAKPSSNDEAEDGGSAPDQTPKSPQPTSKGEIITRKRLRAQRIGQRDVVIDVLKNLGNEEYKASNWIAAANIYCQILSHYGPSAVIFSNLAAALLKLQKNTEAEMAATDALLCDPTNYKARFRRAMARKALGRFVAAECDLSHMLHLDSVETKEAFKESLACQEKIEELKQRFRKSWKDPPSLDPLTKDRDEDWPGFDETPEMEYEVVSDTEDSRHFACGVPCKDYNNDGCSKGKACKFAHCADSLSWRDEIGRNVCILYLLGSCNIKDCRYAHDRSHLSSGWWTSSELTGGLKKLVHEDEPTNLKVFINSHVKPVNQSGSSASTSQASKPVRHILVLFMDGAPGRSSELLTTSTAQVKLVCAVSQTEALRHLSNPQFSGVVVADSAVANSSNSAVVQKLVAFAKFGGTVVFGADFCGHVVPKQMDKLFQGSWNLSWRAGSYSRNVSSLNATHALAQKTSSLPLAYNVKALSLRSVDKADVIYAPTGDSSASSSEVPVAFRPYGKGYVGYVGDVNWESDSFQIMLGMLDVLPTVATKNVKGTEAQIKRAQEIITQLPTVHFNDSFKERIQGFQLIGMDKSTLLNREVPRPVPPRPPPRPFILLISGGGLLSDVDDIQILRNLDTQRNLDLLGSADLKGVFVGSCELLKPEFAYLVYRLAEYTKRGGTVILGGCFTHIETHEAKPFYENWGLNWEIGTSTTCEIEMNPDHPLVKQHPDIANSLPVKMRLEAQHMLGVAPESVLYAAEPLGQYGQGAVIHAKVGKGHLGYIGNKGLGMLSDLHTTLVLSMLGLPP